MNAESLTPWLDRIDFWKWEKQWQELLPTGQFPIEEIFQAIFQGDILRAIVLFWDSSIGSTLEQLSVGKKWILSVLIIGLISTLFTTMKDTFQNTQIADLAFLLHYFILVVLLTEFFEVGMELATDILQTITKFMELFFPTFFLVMGFSGKTVSGLFYYQLSNLVIYMFELLLQRLLFPLLSVYILLVILNGIWGEERLKLFLELCKKFFLCVLKAAFWMLTGTGALEALLGPVMDRNKAILWEKAVDTIPGAGGVLSGTAKIWLGTAGLVKNSIGILGMLFLLALTLLPLIKLFLMAISIKVVAAFLGLVGDKRIVSTTNEMGEGMLLLVKMLAIGITLFMLFVGIAAFSTVG